MDDIDERVRKVFTQRLKINPELMIRENYTKHLTGKLFSMRGRDLVYLFFELEKEFQFKFNTDQFHDGCFNTIQGIETLIHDQMKCFERR